MLIVSWNVAGLSTTVNRIHDAYGSKQAVAAAAAAAAASSSQSSSSNNDGGKKKATTTAPSSASNKSNSSNALRYFFERHGDADVVCLQEHKIPRQQLSSRSEPRRCSCAEGYESFWSCCTAADKRGFNGVVTYAKIGTVSRADPSPLGSPDLDGQGRCVMTDHGDFVLFNVYVPNAGGQPMSYKMKFLNALRRRMQAERRLNSNNSGNGKGGKPVILVGDMNIAHTKYDIFWKDRTIHVRDVLEQVNAIIPDSNSSPSADGAAATAESGGDERREISRAPQQWKRDVARHWGAIVAALETKEAVPTKTRNPRTNEEYQKYRVGVTLQDGSNRKVFLGKHESTPEFCLDRYDFDEWGYRDEDADEYVLCRERDAVRLHVLAELMSKIAGVAWDERTLRQIAESDDATINRASPDRRWLTAIQQEDGMVDAFRHFYPEARGRFTVWHQFTNCRYINDGSRIDLTLVDRSLFDHVRKGDVPGLRCCSRAGNSAIVKKGENGAVPPPAAPAQQRREDGREYHLTEEAALAAATANGRFEPASFEGGGIQEVPQETLDSQFEGLPHTGMIYTPPSFSDHIGISLLLDDSGVPGARGLTLDERDSATRKAQPHKLQKTIASFFGTSSSSVNAAVNGAKILPTNNKRPRLSSSGTSSNIGSDTKNAKKIPAGSILNQLKAQPLNKDGPDATKPPSSTSNAGGGRVSTSDSAKQRPSSAIVSSFSKSSGNKGKAGTKSGSKTGKKQAQPAKLPKNSILNHFQRRPKDA